MAVVREGSYGARARQGGGDDEGRGWEGRRREGDRARVRLAVRAGDNGERGGKGEWRGASDEVGGTKGGGDGVGAVRARARAVGMRVGV